MTSERADRRRADTQPVITREPAVLLHTPAQAARVLAVPEAWLRRKAGRRVIPCTFLGKHLRFSTTDLERIAHEGEVPVRRSPDHRR
jgi:excisionase family DNA binding protein